MTQVSLAMVASLRSGFRDFKVNAIKDGLPENLREAEFEVPEIDPNKFNEGD